ncbi:MAG: DUF962 domain-containing protein [Gammaproteobacteria bacterium]|nr:DUF962 domain-containing protein [Gammaproteobacteria bacterium]
MTEDGRPVEDWIARYARSHQHPVNRFCHTLGIPLIVVSLVMALAAPAVDGLWQFALALFIGGWVLQFIGHWFEGKPPEFFSDWRFLFVGLRWWLAKVRGRA